MAMDNRTAKDIVNSLIEAGVDTPYEGSWAHQEQTREKKPITPEQERQRRAGDLIGGVKLHDLEDEVEEVEDAEEVDQDHADALADIEDGDCAIIQDNGFNCTCSFGGEDLTRAAREHVLKQGRGLEAVGVDDCLAVIKAKAEDEGYFPAVYSINDHGNVSILDPKTGNAIKSWV